jgi:hypothetical protein
MLVRLALIWNEWGFEDVNAYLGAAHRLRDGAPLYDGSLDPDSYRVFRYAPWFAWVWVPLSYLPTSLVTWGWGFVLAVAAGAILLRLGQLRQPAAWALAFLMTPWLVSLVQVGNIQPLVVAALAFGISRRSGPLWIGLAAALKGVPLLFGLVYVARREWMRVGLTLAATAVLLAPFLLYDLSGYQTDPGRSFSIYYYVSPAAWAAGAAASTVIALLLALRRSPYAFVACAVAVMLLAPRTHVTYASYLLIGILNGGLDRIGGDAPAD